MKVQELSHRGFVAVTTAELEPGCELPARLVDGATNSPIHIEVVVESRVVPGERGPGSPCGIRFRLLRFSVEYGRLLSGDPSTHPQGRPDRQSERSSQTDRRRDEEEWLADVLEKGDEPQRQKGAHEQEWPEWEEHEPLWERTGEPLWAEDSAIPEAIVIDDGELDDVVDVLAEMGVKVERWSPDRDMSFTQRIRPEKLLVVTAKRALTLELPLRSEGQGFVSIAVSDSDARMVCSRLRHLGYQLVVSRPIHPLAMSMLLRQTIFGRDDRRVNPRKVLGLSVRWWCGWGRKQPGVLMDVSPVCCQLLVEGAAAKGSHVKIRVPGEVAGELDFTIAGRVIRSSGRNAESVLGVSFDDLSAKRQRALQKLLALAGPCRQTDESPRVEDDADTSGSDEKGHDSTQPARRRNYRAVMRQEVLALEQDSLEIRHVLMSTDLTVDGMHVEAHPSLVMGEEMDLALYEESDRSSLMVSAVVQRDDGRRGWWLRFIRVTPEVHGRLIQILDRFPPVTSLEGSDSELGRVVLTQVLAHTRATGKDELT
jgi:hypothetical protein